MRLPLLIAMAAGCAAPIDGELETHELDATHVDQTFTLNVFIPDTADGPLDVVYLFDGDDWTETTASIVSALARDGVVDAPMVVGIGYGDTPNERGRDYTPPGPGVPDGHGEVEAFYGFMVDELVPWVDDAFDTRPDPSGRVVLGHSFGGIAAVWGLLHASDTFGGAVALSPSLAMGDGVLFEHEATLAEQTDTLQARVHLGAGALEAHGLAGLTEAFGETLESRGYDGLSLQTELVSGRIHADVFRPAAHSGLAFVLDQP